MRRICYVMLIMLGCLLSVDRVSAIASQNFTFVNSEQNNSQLNYAMNFQYIASATTLAEPGMYALSQRIDFNPTTSGQACITIASNDVVLDLNLKSIAQIPTNTQLGIVGININPGCSNILIKGGTLQNLTGTGIVVNDGVNVIYLYDITIIGAGQAGIAFDGLASGTGIKNVIATTIEVQSAYGQIQDFYGLYMQEVSAAQIENFICSNSYSLAGNCHGLYAKYCDSVRVKSSIITELQAANYTTGLYALDCSGFLLIDVAVANMTGESLTSGFCFNSCQNMFLDSCSTFNNVSTTTAIGINFIGSSYCQAYNCQTYSNAGGFAGCGVMSSNGWNNSFESCQSAGNKGEVNGYGFLFIDELGSMVQDSLAEVNIGYTSTSVGICLLSSPTCFVTNNQLLGQLMGQYAYGLFDDAGANTYSYYISNFAAKNVTNYYPASPTIEIYSGGLAGTPGPYQNVSL